MYKSLSILLVLLMLTSCDDGDIITLDLTFDQELQLCGDENSENYVIYTIKDQGSYESLTLLFPGSATYDLIFNPTETPHMGEFNVNNSSIKFNYRTYNGDPTGLICQEIPSSDVRITNDYPAGNGTVHYTSTFEDVDGIRTVTVKFTIEGLDLDILNSTQEDLGTYTWDFPL